MRNYQWGDILEEDLKSEEKLRISLGNMNGIPIVNKNWKNELSKKSLLKFSFRFYSLT